MVPTTAVMIPDQRLRLIGVRASALLPREAAESNITLLQRELSLF